MAGQDHDQGATILIDEKTGNLTASRRRRRPCSCSRRPIRKPVHAGRCSPPARRETFVYNDAKRLATYTGNAKVDGTQGNVTGDRIELFLKPGVNELERAVAYGSKGSVIVREGQRLAKGDHLTHTAADDNYMMIGKPVELTEEKNGTCTLTVGTKVTFSRATESAQAEGNGTFPHNTVTAQDLPSGAETLDGDTERARADESVWRTDGRQGRRHRCRLRRGRRTARTERRRQDHDVLDGRRTCRSRLWTRHARRAGRHRRADVHPGAEGDRLPAAGSVDLPRPDRRAEHLGDPRDAGPRCAPAAARACASCWPNWI